MLDTHVLQDWQYHAEQIRGEVVSDPAEAAFLHTIGQQLGMATTCPNCFRHQLNALLDDSEVYSYGAAPGITYHWDIARAKIIIVRDQLAPISFESDLGWQMLIGHDATLAHVDHLPATALIEPIILAEALPNAQFRSHALIDGTHRLLRTLRDGGEIRAFVLDRQRSQAARITEDEIVITGLSLLNKLSRIVRIHEKG
jgi:hypothetical protein